jgi:hypothetical protein
MSSPSDPLTQFWDTLFSRQPERIRGVFIPLDDATRQALVQHLLRMVTEPDWHPEQRSSAQAALDAIHDLI